MRVLVIKLSAFGDIIHAFPALDDLLRRPEVTEVHWLIDARYGFVAELLPEGVVPHIVRLKGRGGWRRGLAMARRLRALRFDCVLDLQGLIKSGLMAWAIGAPRWGFDRTQSPEWPNRWLVRPVMFHPGERHVVQCYRRIAAAPFTGGTEDVPEAPMDYRPPEVRLVEGMEARAANLRGQWRLAEGFIACHVGGSYATKQLPETSWRAVLSRLAPSRPVLLLWGTEDEQARARRVAEGIVGVQVAEERLPIALLAALLRQAAGYIGPDSGVTHLAAAVGCHTVTLWGPTAPWRMGALGETDHHVVATSGCAPCFRRRCDDFICMPSLDPEEITAFFRNEVV